MSSKNTFVYVVVWFHLFYKDKTHELLLQAPVCHGSFATQKYHCKWNKMLFAIWSKSFLRWRIFCSGSVSYDVKELLATVCSQPQAGSKMDGELSSLKIGNSASSSQKEKRISGYDSSASWRHLAFYLLSVCLSSSSLSFPFFFPCNRQLKGLNDTS